MNGYTFPGLRETGRFATVGNQSTRHTNLPRFSGRMEQLEKELADLKVLQAEYSKLNQPFSGLHSDKKVSKVVDLSSHSSSSDYQKSFAPLKRLKSRMDPDNVIPMDAFAEALKTMVADGLLIEKDIQDRREPDQAY